MSHRRPPPSAVPAWTTVPEDLTPQQLEDCRRLWDAQHKDESAVVDDSHSNSNSNSKSQQSSTTPLEPLTLKNIVRLHHFFLTMLLRTTHAMDTSLGSSTSSSGGRHDPELSVRASCVAPYVHLFLPTKTDSHRTSPPPSTTEIRLRTGVHVVTMHYEEFTTELNRFEYQGRSPPPPPPPPAAANNGGEDAGEEHEATSAIAMTNTLPDNYNHFVRTQSIGAWLHHFPLQALPALNVSMALAVATLWRNQQLQQLQQPLPDDSASKIHRFVTSCQCMLRLIHVKPQLPMADVKTGLVQKFVSIKGNVIKARPKRLRVVSADFMCQKCLTILPHCSMDQGRFRVPPRCLVDSCRSKSFTLLRSTAKYTNVQEVRLQESQEESTLQAGRTPRQLEVLLTHLDLIDSCRPGDTILLACYVDAINTAVAAGKTGKRALEETSTYTLFLQGHSITTLSERGGINSNGGSGTSGQQQQQQQQSQNQQAVYSQQQIQNITQLCHADHRCLSLTERRAFPFDLLVRSVCPSIIGHHTVKAGILLCLLGGTPSTSLQQQQDRGSSSIRSNSHILIVGDPGMGKSQMLNAATQLAARSVYVGGNTASTTGLTVTLTKEEGGETGIEAGALVLADQGVACIDELDKCKHLDGLLEAMEQQQVSIAKAGVVASLPARCSVIAAANPKHGSYNMSKTVAENLNISRPILSRFDLVFILRDRADKDQDRLVSSNIINLYRRQGVEGPSGSSTSTADATQAATAQLAERYLSNDKENMNQDSTQDPFPPHQDPAGPRRENRVPLEKRLAWVAGFNQALPADLVRDYIAYAREFCKPKLTVEAAEVLQEYYMDLRYPSNGRHRKDTVPITTRQLEALIRLSQARAKACLREFVLREDALDVVDLLKQSVEQVHTDEYGIVDRTRAGAAGLSNRKMRKLFIKEVQTLIGVGAECSLDDLRRVADRIECSISEFQTMIEDMRENGILMRKPDGGYKVLS